MNVVMLGRPGAGKGTQSKSIASQRGLRHLSTGELLRTAKQQDTPLGRRIAQRIDAGDFVTDELAMSLVEQAMQSPSQLGYVFDGIPRTLGQDSLLSDSLAKLGNKIDLAILLDVGEETVRNRLLNRAAIEGRHDDTVETIGHRLAVYETETSPLVDCYRQQGVLRSIDGSGTPEDVLCLVLAALDEMTPGEAALNAI
ncbi:MAG: adenylate kinase [Planctomycetota bacterium]